MNIYIYYLNLTSRNENLVFPKRKSNIEKNKKKK